MFQTLFLVLGNQYCKWDRPGPFAHMAYILERKMGIWELSAQVINNRYKFICRKVGQTKRESQCQFLPCFTLPVESPWKRWGGWQRKEVSTRPRSQTSYPLYRKEVRSRQAQKPRGPHLSSFHFYSSHALLGKFLWEGHCWPYPKPFFTLSSYSWKATHRFSNKHFLTSFVSSDPPGNRRQDGVRVRDLLGKMIMKEDREEWVGVVRERLQTTVHFREEMGWRRIK